MSTGTEPQAAAGAAATATAEEAPVDLLSQIVKATKPQSEAEVTLSKSYFQEYLKNVVSQGPNIDGDVEKSIKYWIAQLDAKLSAQINEVMHQPEFQKLEGTWRGLHYLVHESETGTNLKIRVINVTKRELFKDLEKASEFDQSQLFKKIYTAEYDQLGGKPYGMLVGDYDFGYQAEEVDLLRMISNVAAAAHAPFVAAAGAKMFGMDSYTEMPNPRDLAKIFEGANYTKWRSFRDSEDSRYAALAMPRTLARLPYGQDFKKVDEFNFEEFVDGKDHSKYLWMNAAWAYAARITSAFAENGWMARSRGVKGGGKVENLPVHTFNTDDGDVVMKCPTEIAISDRRENELSELGFLPLLWCKDSDFAAFLGSQSCQKAKKYSSNPDANASAELSTKFNYMLNTSRFAHYLKVMVRDHIGSHMSVGELTTMLNTWVNQYVTPNPEAVSDKIKAQKPLSEARIDVRPVAGKPGTYEAVAYMKPHFQLEKLTAQLSLVAELPKPRT